MDSTFLLLIYEFFKTGLFAVGGGMATVPFLKEIARTYPWFTENELLDMIAVSESTPGPIGVNMATYSGFRAGGLPGALCSTLSLVAPSIIIILIVSRMMRQFQENRLVQHAFYCLRPASAGLIIGAMASIYHETLFHPGAASLVEWLNPPALALFALFLAGVIRFKKLHPVVFIALGAVCGIVFQL